MEGAWLISYAVLWLLVLGLAMVVLAHSRLLGILHHRFGPAAAKPLGDGPDVGTSFKTIEAVRFDQTRWSWPFPAERDLLLLFLSPQCQTCDRLAPHVVDFARANRHVEVALFSTLDDRGMNEAFVAFRRLNELIYVNGVRLADEFDIEGTPYGVWIDKNGVVRAKGVTNHYEHLASLSVQASQRRAAAVPAEGDVSTTLVGIAHSK